MSSSKNQIESCHTKWIIQYYHVIVVRKVFFSTFSFNDFRKWSATNPHSLSVCVYVCVCVWEGDVLNTISLNKDGNKESLQWNGICEKKNHLNTVYINNHKCVIKFRLQNDGT